MVTEITLNNQDQGNKTLKKEPVCPKCKVEFGHRVHRGLLFKTVFSWLPVKRYYCYRCKRKHYVMS